MIPYPYHVGCLAVCYGVLVKHKENLHPRAGTLICFPCALEAEIPRPYSAPSTCPHLATAREEPLSLFRQKNVPGGHGRPREAGSGPGPGWAESLPPVREWLMGTDVSLLGSRRGTGRTGCRRKPRPGRRIRADERITSVPGLKIDPGLSGPTAVPPLCLERRARGTGNQWGRAGLP